MENYSRTLYHRQHLTRKAVFLGWLALFFVLTAGCNGIFSPTTYYDFTTYKALTEAKAEMNFLYESFTKNELDMKDVQQMRLTIAKIYEYEKGKGDKNKETVSQIKIIRDMFKEHIADRENGVWNETHMQNKQELILDAFDIAIKTEMLKNKNE